MRKKSGNSERVEEMVGKVDEGLGGTKIKVEETNNKVTWMNYNW